MSSSSNLLGRAPIWAGPAWNPDGSIKVVWQRWFNGLNSVVASSSDSQQGQSIDGPTLAPSTEALALTLVGILSALNNPIRQPIQDNNTDTGYASLPPKVQDKLSAISGPYGISIQTIIGILGSLGITFDSSGNVIITGNLTVDGSYHLVGNSQIDGSSHIVGNSQIDGSETLNGNLHVEQSLQVDVNGHIGGDLVVVGTVEGDGGYVIGADTGENAVILPGFTTLTFNGGILTANT